MLPSDLDPSITTEIHAAITEKAHEKTISSVVVAPNDKFVATGSMDKTAKVRNMIFKDRLNKSAKTIQIEYMFLQAH